MADWFEDWFNTEEYLNVYRHRNNAEARQLVDLILSNVKIKEKGNVIDLACGAGRHSILFAQKCFNVTAVDLSKNLLSVAKSVSERAHLNINFVQADLRDFCLTEKFDLAVNLFTSFGYFEDDKENFSLFRNAFNQLYKGGFFVLDYFNVNYVEQNLVPVSEDKTTNGKIVQKRSIEGNRVEKEIIIYRNGSKKKYKESVRMYNETELCAALASLGFSIEKKFGDFQGNSFDLETSPRIIIIAQK